MVETAVHDSIKTEDLIHDAIAKGMPFALWRMPKGKKFHLLLTEEQAVKEIKIDFEENGPGFCIAPFDSSRGTGWFLPATNCFSFLPNASIPSAYYQNLSLRKSHDLSFPEFLEKKTDKVDFLDLVNKAKAAIENSELNKVVVSRKKEFHYTGSFPYFLHFKELCAKHPHAFVSMTYLPWLKHVWMCASPETLVAQNQEGIFKTMALAGTQSAIDKNGNFIAEKEALWSQKEIEEQALVSRYIINCFKKLRVREYEETGPRTFKAGNLLHLSTLYSVDTKPIAFPQLGSVMLELLHPTSAVCGMPKKIASAFLQENETYHREFYSGFLGPVNLEGNSSIFVNLRTMKIEENTISLYAGCGITADSDAEKEWLETEMKMSSILPSSKTS